MEKKHIKDLEKYLQKCLSPLEKPFKLEHAVFIVMKTYELQNVERIWTFGSAQNLLLNYFTTWKFCCLMHKILHEGHKHALRDSFKYNERLNQYCDYWAKQNDHMGICISWYCKVLHEKILFHRKYMNFKGNLQLDYEETQRDSNMRFQLCLDLFDYLESLLHLQRVIFANMAQHHISAASKKGMCRLASLVTVITECNLLCQHSITTLRLLYLQLSPDDISGLRHRFNETLKELKLFYEHVRSQQLPLDNLVIPDFLANPSNLYSFAESLYEPSAPLISDLD